MDDETIAAILAAGILAGKHGQPLTGSDAVRIFKNVHEALRPAAPEASSGDANVSDPKPVMPPNS